MNKKLASLMAAALLAVWTVPAFAAETKFGYIDLAAVFDGYTKTKDLDKSLEAKGGSKQAERDKMVAEVKKKREESELLSAEAKDKKQVEIDEKIKVLQEFDRTTRDALRKERDEMLKGILKEIETVINDFGKAQGYTFIFNDRVLVYKAEGNDLTAPVIKALNDGYAKNKKG